MDMLLPALPAITTLLAYLIGSLSFAVIVSRVIGMADPRSYGSHNPGATNVLRSGNKGAAAVTLALEVLKGYLPVLAVAIYGPRWGLGEGTLAMVGLAAFVGHLWPVFFRFRGGKGVATAAGVLLAFNPWLGLATLATWLIVAFFFRFSSFASLVAAVFAPFYQLLIWNSGPIFLAIIVMSLLLFWRHQANIGKLLAGKESKLGHKAAHAATPAVRGHNAPSPRRGHSHGAAHAARRKAHKGERT